MIDCPSTGHSRLDIIRRRESITLQMNEYPYCYRFRSRCCQRKLWPAPPAHNSGVSRVEWTHVAVISTVIPSYSVLPPILFFFADLALATLRPLLLTSAFIVGIRNSIMIVISVDVAAITRYWYYFSKINYRIFFGLPPAIASNSDFLFTTIHGRILSSNFLFINDCRLW